MMLAELLVRLAWIGAGASVTVGLIVFGLRAYTATLGRR